LNPWVSVGLIAAVTSLAVGLVGVLVFAVVRRHSLRAAAVVAPITAVAAMAFGVLATSRAMFLSSHDLGVVLVVCAVAGLVALGVGVLLARMVRALEDRAASLAEERTRAEQAEQTRRELVAWVSHDLRTPLAGMRAMAEALEDGVVDDPSRYYRQIRVEVDRLSAMVDDLFEVARLQSGAVRLALRQLSVPSLVDDVVAATQPLALSRGVQLRAAAVAGAPVSADEQELRRALTNLVVNAIRHTPRDGSVHVDATVDAEGQAVVTVTDECGGIADDELPRVFDMGWRGNPARTPEPDGGAGLGLAIVQGIVTAHAGEVAVRNVSGGCCFEVRLPQSGPWADALGASG
jgi:signal transduction histidine kinase